jgi:hypothetical protein
VDRVDSGRLAPAGPAVLADADPADWQGEFEDPVPLEIPDDFGDETDHDTWLAAAPPVYEAGPVSQRDLPTVPGFAIEYWRAGDPPPPTPGRIMVVPRIWRHLAARDWLNANGYGPVSISGPLK